MSVSATTPDLGLAPSLVHLVALAAAADGPTKRGEALADLRMALHAYDKRLPAMVAGTYKNGGRGTSYGIVLIGGTEIDLGPAKQLLSMRDAKAAIFEATNIPLTLGKQEAWDAVAALIAEAADVREGEITEDEVTRGWLADFVAAKGYEVSILDMTDKEALYELLKYPPDCLQDTRGRGRLYVRLRPFHRFVTRVQGASLTQPELSKRLAALGFRGGNEGKVHARWEGDIRTARYWVSREGFDAHE